VSTPLAAARREAQAMFRRPGFFILASATLALAVGIFFATFALVDALLLTPPAFRRPGELVLYGEIVRPSSPRSLSARLYDAIGLPVGVLSRGRARSIERASVRSGGHAGLLAVQRVDAGFLPTLGVVPALGSLALEHAGRDGALVSWRLWKTWYAAAPSVEGRVIMVDGRILPIVGVLPATYRLLEDVDVLLPLRAVPGAAASVPNDFAVARLMPGTSAEGLVAAMRAAVPAVAGNDRERFGMTPLEHTLREASAPTLWFFLGCAVLVLATACGNLANLILARALGRGQETALRRALGAGFWGAWATIATEAMLIGMAGLAAGCVLGHELVVASDSYIPDPWRISAGELAIGWRVYVASALMAVSVVVLAAIGGTLHEHGDAMLRDYVGGGPSQSVRVTAGGIRVALVQFQLVLATVLLSLCVVRLLQAWRTDDVAPGFDLTHATAARFRPDPGHFSTAALVADAMLSIERQSLALSGVLGAGVTTQLPVGTHFQVSFASYEARPVEAQLVMQTPGARAALGMRLIAGRDLSTMDTPDAPGVVVVNEAFLAAIPGAALGGTVHTMSRSLGNRDLRIVGVVADTRDAGPSAPLHPWAIVPFAQLPSTEFAAFRSLLSYYLVFRAADDAAVMGIDPDDAVRTVAPWLVLERARTLSRIWRDSRSAMDRDTWLAGLFAAVGLGLGLVGLYSAQRVEVASRRRDLALCAALGATPGDLLGMCLARGIARALVGVALGLAASFALSRWPPLGLTPGIRLDPTAALIVAVAMLVITSAVVFPPAVRSATTPPWLVLRNP
jgi:putative ABC transport system permease protein